MAARDPTARPDPRDFRPGDSRLRPLLYQTETKPTRLQTAALSKPELCIKDEFPSNRDLQRNTGAGYTPLTL